MAITVGQLREKLLDVSEDVPIMLLFEGNVTSAATVAVAPNGAFAIIRGKGEPRKAKHFSTTEDGLIGGLVTQGLPDEVIADLFERPVDSVKKRKKQLGFG